MKSSKIDKLMQAYQNARRVQWNFADNKDSRQWIEKDIADNAWESIIKYYGDESKAIKAYHKWGKIDIGSISGIISGCSWDVRPGSGNAEAKWVTSTSTGTCSVVKDKNGEVFYKCSGKNGQSDTQEYPSAVKAKSEACAWLNHPEAFKSREALKSEAAKWRKDFAKKSKKAQRKKAVKDWAPVAGFVALVGVVGFAAYKLAPK